MEKNRTIAARNNYVDLLTALLLTIPKVTAKCMMCFNRELFIDEEL